MTTVYGQNSGYGVRIEPRHRPTNTSKSWHEYGMRWNYWRKLPNRTIRIFKWYHFWLVWEVARIKLHVYHYGSFPALDYEIDMPFLELPPLDTDRDSILTHAMVSACKAITGRAKIAAFPGSTDAPNFGRAPGRKE